MDGYIKMNPKEIYCDGGAGPPGFTQGRLEELK
jgi:hypothetical protein